MLFAYQHSSKYLHYKRKSYRFRMTRGWINVIRLFEGGELAVHGHHWLSWSQIELNTSPRATIRLFVQLDWNHMLCLDPNIVKINWPVIRFNSLARACGVWWELILLPVCVCNPLQRLCDQSDTCKALLDWVGDVSEHTHSHTYTKAGIKECTHIHWQVHLPLHKDTHYH